MRWMCLVAWLTALVIIGIALNRPARSEPVDVALVLAVDVSGSVSDSNWMLQRDGIADAIASPEFGRAIVSGAIGRVAILVMQWGSDAKVTVDWRILKGRRDAVVLATDIRTMPRAESGATCMATALLKSSAALAAFPGDAMRLVIDISGDGTHNCGFDLAEARAAVLAQGITINGLPIVTESEPKIAEYYETKVIGGPGAFLIVATLESFAEALRKKLVLEVAEARP